MSSLRTCTSISRIIFGIINLVILLIGLSALGTGIYLLVESQKLSFITENEHYAGPAILIASGTLTTFLALAAICGALFKSRFLLVFYAVAIFIIIALQVASGALGFVYKDTAKDKFEERYADRIIDGIKKYLDDKGARKAIDFLQENFECCGKEGPSDWGMYNGQVIHNNEKELPKSCQCDSDDDDDDDDDDEERDDGSTESDCGVAEPFDYFYTDENGTNTTAMYNSGKNVYLKGCYNDTTSFFEGLAVVYGSVGLAFGIFEIIGLIFALGLVFCFTKNTKEYEVV